MVLIGLSAIVSGMNYHLGTAAHMGPGYFPAGLGALLAFVGLLIAAGARNKDSERPEVQAGGHSTEIPDMRGAICIVLGILAFLLFGEYGGLLPATFAIVFISALGDRSNTLKQCAMIAVAMSVLAVVIFWWGLQLQLPLFRWG